MNLNIVRNYMVGMLTAQSRIGDVVRGAKENYIVPRGKCLLEVMYRPDKNRPPMYNVMIEIKEDSDEKYVAKQFVSMIKKWTETGEIQ